MDVNVDGRCYSRDENGLESPVKRTRTLESPVKRSETPIFTGSSRTGSFIFNRGSPRSGRGSYFHASRTKYNIQKDYFVDADIMRGASCSTKGSRNTTRSLSFARPRSSLMRMISSDHELEGAKERASLISYLEQVNKHKKQILFFNGTFRTFWNILLIIINIYNMICIPLRLSQMPETPQPLNLVWVVDYGCDFILLIDIIIRSFLFSVIMNHVEIFDSKLIYENYTHSWGCVLDICSIIPFDLLAFGTGQQYLPLLRVNRLLRLYRQQHHYDHFLSFLAEWAGVYLVFYCRIARVMCNFIYMTHLCACVWVFIGNVECHGLQWSAIEKSAMADCSVGWMSMDTPIPTSFWRKYCRAIYWGFVTLVTTGYGDIVPVTKLETCFLICVMLIGMSLSTETIAIFTSVFAQTNVAQWQHEQRLEILQSYMESKKLPDSTILTVLDYYKYMWETFKGVDEANILQSLPEHLRKEALTFLEGETIRRAPIFKKMDNSFVRSIAMVLDPIVVCPQKFIYRIGEPATDMWFLNRGRVEIMDREGKILKVRLAESCFGERALLSDDPRKHNAKAINFCQLYKLSRENFDLVLKVLWDDEESVKSVREMMRKRLKIHKRGPTLIRKLSENSVAALQNQKHSLVPKYFFDINILRPLSPQRYGWEILHFLCVVAQIFILVWRCAFAQTPVRPWLPLDIIVDCVFFADFIMRSRFFAYEYTPMENEKKILENSENALFVYDPDLIWNHYKRSNYFWFDAISIIPLDYAVGLGNPNIYVFLKLLRTLRWSRKQYWMGMLSQWSQRTETRLNIDWMRLLMFGLEIVIIGHCMGCMWYLIGDIGNEDLDREVLPTWEEITTDPASFLKVWFDYDELHTADLGRRYLRSLYWAFVTITTVGYGDIRAYTNTETLYAGICVFIGGMMYYASVGHISSLLSRLSFMQKAHFEKGDRLERVMMKNHIPSSLRDRIRQYHRYAWEQQKGISESEILKKLPDALKHEISAALNEDVLSKMRYFDNTDEIFLKKLITRFEYRVYLPNEWIFREGDICFEFCIINFGVAALLTEEGKYLIRYVREGEAVAVAEMHFKLNHTRSLQTKSFCHVSVMNAADLNEILKQYPLDAESVEKNAKVCMENSDREMKAIENNIGMKKVQHLLIGEEGSTGTSVNLIFPDSFFRNVWNVLILVIICYNAFDVPYSIAFLENPDVNDVGMKIYMYSSYFFDLLFCFDVYLHAFRFTFEENGVVNLDPQKVFERFESQWWRSSFDIIAILPVDMVYFFVTGRNNPMLRINKICRSFRVNQLFTELRLWVQKSQILNFSTQTILLVKLLFFMAMSAHIFACTFYFVGNQSRNLGMQTWIEMDFADEDHPEGLYDYPVIMRYTRSFYWALSTMTVVCFGDVTPQTDYTTCFVVIMTIIGFFVIANIIGNISDLLSRMDAEVAILKEKLDLFEHYASQHQLPQKLADRVRKYLTHVYYSQKDVETTSVIAELPKSLRNEISRHLYHRSVRDNRYFVFLEPNLVSEMCSLMVLESYAMHDVITVEGAVCTSFSIILTGHLIVIKCEEMSQEIQCIRKGQTICDVEFFLKRRMPSTLMSGDNTEMLTLSQKDFDRVMIHFPHHLDRMREIARKKYKKQRVVRRNNENNNSFLSRRAKRVTAKSFHNMNLENRCSLFPTNIDNDFSKRIPTASWQYQIWESLVLIVIGLQAGTIVFRACFLKKFHNGWSMGLFMKTFFCDWFMDIILITDIYLHLFKLGVFKDGLEVGNDVECMQNYLAGKFAFNVVASFPIDFISLLLFDTTREHIMTTMIFCRFPKLLRLLDNLQNKYENMETLFTKTWAVVPIKWFRYLSFLGFYLLVGHIVGCVWFAVGHWGRTNDVNNWLENDSDLFSHHEEAIFTNYVRAIYFCLNAMTTTGYGDIISTNQFETVFLLCLIMISTFMFSGMVGVMASTMAGEIQSFAIFERKLNSIRTYMKAKLFPTLLQRRVLQYYAYSWEVKGLDDKTVVESLPEDLQIALGMYIRSPLLKAVSLFRCCPLALMRQLVLKLQPERYMPGDNIMRENEFGNGMYFIDQGVVKIVFSDQEKCRYLYSGAYFGEQALVKFQKRSHSAFAASFCAIFILIRTDLEEILSHYPEWREEICAFRSRLESQNHIRCSKENEKELFNHVCKSSDTFKPKTQRMGSMFLKRLMTPIMEKPNNSFSSTSHLNVMSSVSEQPDFPMEDSNNPELFLRRKKDSLRSTESLEAEKLLFFRGRRDSGFDSRSKRRQSRGLADVEFKA